MTIVITCNREDCTYNDNCNCTSDAIIIDEDCMCDTWEEKDEEEEE